MEVKKLANELAEKIQEANSYRRIRLIFREIKWFFQRVRRGWDDSNTWDLDHYLAKIISETTLHLKDHTHSFPGEGMTFEEWQDMLQQISDAFKDYNDYDDWHMDLLHKEGYGNAETNKKALERYEDIKTRMQLLITWFGHLWD
jgi:hypothetical protein